MKNVIYVVEKDGKPMKAQSEAYVTALMDRGWAMAWAQNIPVTRQESEHLVPYVSVTDLQKLLEGSTTASSKVSKLKEICWQLLAKTPT